MSLEVECSQCQGRLQVLELGSPVECPHCQAHLDIPADGNFAADETADDSPATPAGDQSPPVVSATPAVDVPPVQNGPDLQSPDSELETVETDGISFENLVDHAPPEPLTFPGVPDENPADETAPAFPVVTPPAPANPPQNPTTSPTDAGTEESSSVFDRENRETAAVEMFGSNDGFPDIPDNDAGDEHGTIPTINVDQLTQEMASQATNQKPWRDSAADDVPAFDTNQLESSTVSFPPGIVTDAQAPANPTGELQEHETPESFQINVGEAATSSSPDTSATPPAETTSPAETETVSAGSETVVPTGDPLTFPEFAEATTAPAFPALGGDAPGGDSAPSVTPQAAQEPSATRAVAPQPAATTQAPATTRPAADPRRTSVSGRKSLSAFTFQVWVSYTFIATAAVCLLLYRLLGTSAHQLESLPDKPPLKNTKIVGEHEVVAPGHELKLGESRRFGNIEVTAMRVTRGPIEFQHIFETDRTTDPTEPVLKLWLRFRNVSTDQTIAPLDSDLLFNRGYTEGNSSRERANNFVATRKNKLLRKVVLMYDHIVAGNWDLQDQQLGKELKPGEEIVTYLPCDTWSLDKLTGDLVWRVHFRKGFSPKNYGVTTLIEINFHSDEIKPDDHPSAENSVA